MAKRRKTTKKISTKPKRAFFKAKTKRKGTRSENKSLMQNYLFGAGYGTIRPVINEGINRLSSYLPVRVSDEILIPLALYFTAKGKVPLLKGKTVRHLARAGLIAEGASTGARYGAPMLTNAIFKKSTTPTVSSGSSIR